MRYCARTAVCRGGVQCVVLLVLACAAAQQTLVQRNFTVPRGKYRVVITAVDSAGNRSARASTTTLTVK